MHCSKDQVRARGHVRAAPLVVEQSHFAEVISWAQFSVPAVGGRDLSFTFQDDQEADAALTSDHDLGALRVLDLAHLLANPLEVAWREALEDADRLEVHRRDSTSRRDPSTACARACDRVPRGKAA